VEFSITAGDGDSVKVEAENWMVAMGRALAFFDIDIAACGSLACTTNGDGAIHVEDGTGVERRWIVRRLAPAIEVRVTPGSMREREAAPPDTMDRDDDTEDTQPSLTPLPSILMPGPTLHKEETESLAERLFDLSMDIAASDVSTACNLALDLILSLVPAEAASVAEGTLDDPGLVFVAARGPVSDSIVGRQVRFGEGLVGMCFDMRGTLLVNDVATDVRHLDHFDRETGFRTLAVLCVPILDHEGIGYGVVQLLNPPDRHFTPEHVEVVETTARTLASSLRGRR
jgi:hypothetical protein